MTGEIREDIIETVQALKELLTYGDAITGDLRDLSNDLMEDVSIYRNKDTITISVMLYSLYKIFSKNNSIERKPLLKLIDNIIKNQDNDVQFRASIRKLFDQIKKYDNNIDSNILHIIKQAYINKGLSLYEHGLSIGNAAEIMGISKWEIMEYLSEIKIIDTDENARIDCRERLNYARGLFQ